MHECIHRASTKKFSYDPETQNITDARVGYRLNSSWKKDSSERHKLTGFNEIMNAYTQVKILHTHPKELEKLGISREDVKGPIYPYMRYEPILNKIVEKIAANKNISIMQAFVDLERGQFENNIFALKEVEKSFGKGSIEILAHLMSRALKDRKQRDELDEMIKTFFVTGNEQEREEARVRIHEFVKDHTDSSKVKSGE